MQYIYICVLYILEYSCYYCIIYESVSIYTAYAAALCIDWKSLGSYWVTLISRQSLQMGSHQSGWATHFAFAYWMSRPKADHRPPRVVQADGYAMEELGRDRRSMQCSWSAGRNIRARTDIEAWCTQLQWQCLKKVEKIDTASVQLVYRCVQSAVEKSRGALAFLAIGPWYDSGWFISIQMFQENYCRRTICIIYITPFKPTASLNLFSTTIEQQSHVTGTWSSLTCLTIRWFWHQNR